MAWYPGKLIRRFIGERTIISGEKDTGELKPLNVILIGDVYYWAVSVPRWLEAKNEIYFSAIFSKYQNKGYDVSELRRIANVVHYELPNYMDPKYPDVKFEYKYEESPTGGYAIVRGEYSGITGPAARDRAEYMWKDFKKYVRNICKKYGYKVKIVRQKLTFHPRRMTPLH